MLVQRSQPLLSVAFDRPLSSLSSPSPFSFSFVGFVAMDRVLRAPLRTPRIKLIDKGDVPERKRNKGEQKTTSLRFSQNNLGHTKKKRAHVGPHHSAAFWV